MLDPRYIACILAQQTAMKIVKSHVRKQGRIRISEVSHAMWTKLAREYLAEHRELIDTELQRDQCWELARPRRRRAVSYYQITAKG
jgi:hypothetical protein